MNAVEPTTSAIRTVRRFRSPSRAARVAKIPVVRFEALRVLVAVCRVDLQRMHVVAFGELRHPQPAHICTSTDPQFAQKFASESFLYRHVSQSMQADLSSQLTGSDSAGWFGERRQTPTWKYGG
jgi:hypothetical protein